ncbi:hypothetical protein EN45_062140 [Penicillium chrysogenum]|uniref:Capsule polysaccharide biosynthesis protein n=1 Tax=Penicillium chrysogenum TaxID=5076 RepID=A0A167SXG3_PENCH|nr:hypothetical protein EN45_062140 [Penicillium chrysogenum]
MPQSKFSIPAEFRDQLEVAEPLDSRSDEAILVSLSKHKPVTSEKNIWAFWHAGAAAMPQWCQRNIIDWHRICGPSWTIRVLDTVPNSPNHALKYIRPELLPETFVKGTMDGPYVGPHSADFLRGASLYMYGGVFMDAGIILTRSLDRICWPAIADPTTPYNGDPFIQRWHELFVHVWKDKNSYKGMTENPLLSFALKQDFSASVARGFKWEFIVDPLTVFEYITQVVAWQRLCLLEEAGDGFSCVDYAGENIMWFDVLEENWGFETIAGFTGQEAFDVLATRLDADSESEEYKKAYKMAWHFLAQCSMQKITHGKHLTKTPALGLLWDLEGNEGKHDEEGTFAELLRYGTVHFRQTREGIRVVDVERPKETMRKGVLEP